MFLFSCSPMNIVHRFELTIYRVFVALVLMLSDSFKTVDGVRSVKEIKVVRY